MLVFLSWSGEVSRMTAEALREWLPTVIQAVKPWMSTEDIDKGARWSIDIASRLEEAKVGVVCLAPDNIRAPWLLFEAGALSKALGEARVCTYLLGLRPTDIKGPLVQFQATEATKSETFKLLKTINDALEEGRLPESALERVFEKWWPELEERLTRIRVRPAEEAPARSDRDILEETLTLVRSLAKGEAEDTVPWNGECPICGGPVQVKDSRPARNGIRRRRLCTKCRNEFATLERIETVGDPLMVPSVRWNDMIRDLLNASAKGVGAEE